MTILERIVATSSKEELKALFISDIKPIKYIDSQIEDALDKIETLNNGIKEGREQIGAGFEGYTVDEVMDVVRNQLGKLSSGYLES